MDERRARIYDDLRDVIEGELYFRALDRAPYAHDASLYEIDPLGVVVPRTEDDVVTAVRYAAENGIPIHPRGAGTDTGGGALGPGLVIDLSRHLRRVIAIEPEHVVVEAGVVPDQLNAQLATVGRRLEPIPRDPDVTTIGGMIAVDAAGGRSLRYGSIGDQVERLRVVFAGGERADLGYEPWPAFESEPAGLEGADRPQAPDPVPRGRRTGSIAPARPRRETAAGYALDRAADDAGIHLGRLVAGSEGTLALVTQADAPHGAASRRPGGAPAAVRPALARRGLRARAARAPGGPLAPATCSTAARSDWPATPTRSSATRSTSRPSRSWCSSTRRGDSLRARPSRVRMAIDRAEPHGIAGRGAGDVLQAGGMRASPRLAATGRGPADAVPRARRGPSPSSTMSPCLRSGSPRVLERLQRLFQARGYHLDPRCLRRRGPAATPAVPRPVRADGSRARWSR